ncbi:MAG: hypothetical protein ACFUZC_16935 [Chthoniobacteraceae bacterium]
MNTAIESAFLAAVSSLPELAGVEQHTGVSGDENTVEGAAIIVHCPDCEHTVGPLWKSTIVFRLESPAFDNERDAHEQRLNAVRAWLDDHDAVTAGLRLNGMGLSGYFVRKSQTSLEHSRWVVEIEIVAGVDTTPNA